MIGIVIHSTPIRSVAFVCPHCGVDRDGAVVERRRWLAVLGVRVLPLGELAPMVSCTACSQQCGVGVLTIPTALQLAAMLQEAMRYAVSTILRRSVQPISDAAERHAVAMMRSSGFVYDRFDLDSDLREFHDTGTVPHMLPLADELTLHGKQALLHRLHGLAVVDGALRPAQREALLRIGIALGMAAPHINGVLAVADADRQDA